MIKIYLAAALNSPELRARNIELRDIIKRLYRGGTTMQNRIVVYLPQEFLLLKKDATAQERKDVFYENIDRMRSSDFIIAIMDEKDTGVIWECGFAFEKKPVVGVYINPQLSVNVMLAQAWYATCLGEVAFRSWLANPRPSEYKGGIV